MSTYRRGYPARRRCQASKRFDIQIANSLTSPMAIKKADVTNTRRVFSRVGLLCNWPPEQSGCHLLSRPKFLCASTMNLGGASQHRATTVSHSLKWHGLWKPLSLLRFTIDGWLGQSEHDHFFSRDRANVVV